MKLTSIISAIGNNDSIYPLLIRDCGIENPTKVVMTYKQNKADKNIAKNATRERIIDEYITSSIWLGGIPLVTKICDKLIKSKGFNPDISIELLKDNKNQSLKTNIENFRFKAPKEANDLIKVQNNLSCFKQLNTFKTISSIVIPTIAMGFILPKLNFALTRKIMKKPSKNDISFRNQMTLDEFKNNTKSQNNISFTSLSTVQKMAITDGGLSIGRVACARNKNEAFDNGVKMAGMMYLNYIAPKQLAKFLNKMSQMIFKTQVNLDYKILCDDEFIKKVKENAILLPNKTDEKEILDFIDKNINSTFVQSAKKINLIKTLDNNTRDPRKYVDTNEIVKLKNDIYEFIKNAKNSKNFDSFIKKARAIKGLNILANIVISSFLLAFALPKFQFLLRQIVIKNKFEPGLVDDNYKKSKKQ